MRKGLVYSIIIFLFIFTWFNAASADLSGIVSDDFNAAVIDSNTWTFINPYGDATLSMTGANLEISVPAGTSHDVWSGGNFAPRIMQAARNTDYDLEVRFDSTVNERYEMQGVIIEQDSNNYLRFDFYSDGTNTFIFAASFINGYPAAMNNSVISGAPITIPLYMRVKRAGNQWTQSYSYDGVVWNISKTFSHTISVTSVGVFAGNAFNNTAFTGSVNYFFNNASPIFLSDFNNNVLNNPGFESGTSPWGFYTNGAGTFLNDAPGYGSPLAGHIKILQQGTNVQLYQAGLVLEPDTEYILSFKAYSNKGHDLSVVLQTHGSPYTSYGLSYSVFNITPSWSEYSVQFTTTGFSGTVSDGRLMFWLAPYAAAGDQYFIDDVALFKTSSVAPVPPTVTTHPVNQVVTVGRAATLNVAATGAMPLFYQWQKNGVNISGATAASYTTPAATLADNGSTYRCIVTSPAGSATSNTATLTFI